MQWKSIDAAFILKKSKQDFEAFAMDLYQYQAAQNPLYRAYHSALKLEPSQVQTIDQIPFLPISFFKNHQILCGANPTYEYYFESSGTSGMLQSKHFITDTALYTTLALHAFEAIMGNLKEWTLLALLPSYLERGHSSLVFMAQKMMEHSQAADNGFYLDNYEALHQKIIKLQAQQKKVLLLGVTFALLDFAEQYPYDYSKIVVMETGGMKGRKKELTRAEVHQYLQAQWHLEQVHSEYGMTELLSQAYAQKEGLFTPSLTMRVLVRDIHDPLTTMFNGQGALNIIDLANIHSCAFIATEDIGHVYPNGTFEVLGRMDHTALRGCSLLAL